MTNKSNNNFTTFYIILALENANSTITILTT